MFHVAAVDGESAGRKPHRVRQASNRDQIDPLLERLSCRHERSPFVGTEGADARLNLFAALALPAPVGVFLRRENDSDEKLWDYRSRH
jgi:hypothetical protein